MILPPTFTADGKTIFTVIETPAGSRAKYDYDPEYDCFKLSKFLPSGTSFPLDFGFIPHTKGEDGDPLDVLVIMDTPSYPGCIVECRLIGVLKAEQREHTGKTVRNDRLLAVASHSLDYSHLENIKDVNKNLLDEVVHFFEYYNEMAGKKFTLLGKRNKKVAMEVLKNNITNKK